MSVLQFHVAPCGDKWQVSREGASVGLFDTQIEAMQQASGHAQRERPSTIVVDKYAAGDGVTQSITRAEA